MLRMQDDIEFNMNFSIIEFLKRGGEAEERCRKFSTRVCADWRWGESAE